jgi:hypothetical protein
MFVGQSKLISPSGAWRPPWAVFWPRDQNSRLRHDQTGQRGIDLRGDQGQGQFLRGEEDHGAPFDDRSGLGLRDRREGGGRKSIFKWRNKAIARSQPPGPLNGIAEGPHPSGTRGWISNPWRDPRNRWATILWALLLLIFLPLEDKDIQSAESVYDHARTLFQHGALADSQRESELGYKEFQVDRPEEAIKLGLLEAEAMVWRGTYDDALRLLFALPRPRDREQAVKKLALQGAISTHQLHFPQASRQLAEAEGLCGEATYPACGEILQARGILAVQEGETARSATAFH